MSAAFVPAFTRHLTLDGKAAAWRLGNNVLNALLIVDAARSSSLGHDLRAAARRRPYAGDYARVPGKLELTIQLTRVMLPFLTLAAVAAAMMGMLNSLHHYFVPALSPAMFNVATIVVRAGARAGRCRRLGLPAIMAIAIGALARRRRRRSSCSGRALRARRIPLSAGARLARPGTAADPRADGAGHDRAGGDAGEYVRQHAARHGRRHRRGVVADLRLPADVPADRPVRRVDRDRRAAGGGAARGARRSRGGPRRRCRAGWD